MERHSDKHIVVLDFNKKTIRYLKEKTVSGNSVFWVYFGKNVSNFLEIKRTLGSCGVNIPISEKLQANAEKYRQDFIDGLGSLAAGTRNPWWYLTSISEKNPYVSDLYLNFCYLKTFFGISWPQGNTVFVICESPSLIKTIVENSSDITGIEYLPLISLHEKVVQRISSKIHQFFHKSFFILRFVSRIMLARLLSFFKRKRCMEGQDNPIVIHSWADYRSFSSDKQYSDIYFGDLPERLNNEGRSYFLLVDILPTIWYLTALKKIFAVKKPVHLFEDFLGFSDILDAITIFSKIPQCIPQKTSISGLLITDLLQDELQKDHQNSRIELSYLYYAAGKRMARTYNIFSFVYTFENHIWEKMMIMGIHEITDVTRIIGYAHATVNSTELSYSLSSREKDYIPLPDCILVNGEKPKNVLVASGFDATRIHVLGSIRYGNLLSPMIQNDLPKTESRILVILSADINRSLEMMNKCIEAFGQTPQFLITFKPHPIQKTSVIFEFSKGLPQRFQVSLEPLQGLLKITDAVIFSDSTASVEAAALGIPLLHIKSDFLIDTNIFNKDQFVPSVSSPDDIRISASMLIQQPEASLMAYKSHILTSIQGLFAPVDENVMMREIVLKDES